MPALLSQPPALITIDTHRRRRTEANDPQYLLRARAHSVTVDGIVGAVTWQALVSGMYSF